jgi:hypothetical protein
MPSSSSTRPNTAPTPFTRAMSARWTRSARISGAIFVARAKASRSSATAAAARSWSQVVIRLTFSATRAWNGTPRSLLIGSTGVAAFGCPSNAFR